MKRKNDPPGVYVNRDFRPRRLVDVRWLWVAAVAGAAAVVAGEIIAGLLLG